MLLLRIVLIVSVIVICFSKMSQPVADDVAEVSVYELAVIRPEFCVGYEGFFSSVVWVKGLFEYSDFLFEKGNDRFASSIQKAISLDTLWAAPQEFAVFVFPSASPKSRSVSADIISDAIRRFPKKWQYRLMLSQLVIEEVKPIERAYDSAGKIMYEIAASSDSVPDYVRGLAFTYMNNQGDPSRAISVLSQVYAQVEQPYAKFQLRQKLGNLLMRNRVILNDDSLDFVNGVTSLLDSDSSQASFAKDLLIRLVQPETKHAALLEARHLARQFRAYQAAQVGVSQ